MNQRQVTGLVFIFYLSITLIFTFPLVFHLSDSTYGYSGDNLGSIHYFWWWKESFLKGRDVRDSYLEEAPFGVTIDQEPGTVFFYWPVKFLTLLLDDVTAYNLVLLLSFPTAALAMYTLVRFVLRQFNGGQSDRIVTVLAFLSGFIFSFSPYHFWKAYNHLDLSLIWPLPLFFLALLYLEKSSVIGQVKTLWRAVWFLSLVWAATILTNFYYGYFLLLLLLTYLFAKTFSTFVLERKFYLTRRLLWSIFLSALLTFLLVLPAMYSTLINQQSRGGQSFLRRDSYERPLMNLVSLSSRPWDFLLPSTDHPFWGSFSKNVIRWIQEKGRDFKTVSGPAHERNIYLGLINLVLFVLSFVLLIKSGDFRRRFGRLVLSLQISAAFLTLVSSPPYIFLGGRTIYLPAFFLYQVFPMFRTYLRLGVLVLMLVTVISCLVLYYLWPRPLNRRRSLVFWGFLIFLSGFDFLNFPPSKSIDLKTPPSYQWLTQREGQFSVIEYPQDFNVSEALFFQRMHRKGVLNFHSTSPYFGFWEILADYRVPRVARILDALGVRYALFHKALIFTQENPVDDLWYRRAFRELPYYQGGFSGFKLAADFPETAVFEIERPSNPAALAVLTSDWDEVKAVSFPHTAWVWSGRESDLYLINLVDGARFLISLDLPGLLAVRERVRSVSFNGEIVVPSESGRFELWLANKFNTLKFGKGDAEPINLGEVRVSVIEGNYQ